MKTSIFSILLFLFVLGCDSRTEQSQNYIIEVQSTNLLTEFPDCSALIPDTLQGNSRIELYNKAVQRYASALLCIHSGKPKSDLNLDGIDVFDIDGNPISLDISQQQKDSVIMEFIKFARSSSIPYHETVKNFELKMMSLR